MSSGPRRRLTHMIDLRPAAQRTIGLVASVAEGQLDGPTPCPGMCVGDLIDHIGVFAVRFVEAAHKNTGDRTSPPPPPDVANLEAGWRERIARDLLGLADAWGDPSAWTGATHAGGIRLPGEVVGLVALDELVVHGWDLAVATDQPYAPSAAEIEAARAFVASFDAPRDGQLFGPVVAVAADAPALDRLLGLTGRDPSWQPPG